MKILSCFLLSLFLGLSISCKKDNTILIPLLKQAQDIVSSDPEKALSLLDSIQCLEEMDNDNYMQYIVTRVQAKYKAKQDITSDTIIFKAERYFENKGNIEQAAIAHFYAGALSRKAKRYDKSLLSFLKSADCYIKVKDNELSGVSFEYIGYVYFEQCVMDSAIANYQKAIKFYDIEKNTPYILRVTNQIGRAYEHITKLDSAFSYFNNALQIAENLNDIQLISTITQNLGLTCFDIGEYNRAIEYFQSALDMPTTKEKQKRQIYMSLLRIYTIKQDTHTAKEYALKIKESLPEVDFIYTRKDMYAALSSYYKLTGDYKQALQYSNLNKITIQQIKEEESPAALLNADKTFYLIQKDKKIDQLRKYNNYTRFVTELF